MVRSSSPSARRSPAPVRCSRPLHGRFRSCERPSTRPAYDSRSEGHAMNMHLQRQPEMLVRARDFRAANRDAIAASSIAVRVFDDLDACIACIDRLREDEISQDGNLRKLTTAKRFAYVAVLKRMRAAAVASRAMPHGVGSPTARRMPPKRSIGEFIRTALAETDTLAEFADVYRQRGLPDDFVARLRDDINALEDVKRRKDAQASNRKSTRLNSSHIPLSRMPSSA